jgi:hypothetical protein
MSLRLTAPETMGGAAPQMQIEERLIKTFDNRETNASKLNDPKLTGALTKPTNSSLRGLGGAAADRVICCG